MTKSLGSQVLSGSVVVGSMEGSHSSIDMVDQLGVSLGFSLAIISKSSSQMVGGSGVVGSMERSHSSIDMVDQLTKGGGSKAR